MAKMKTNWDIVLDLVSSAETYVLLVSPRINFTVINKIVNLIPESVQNIDCITRWTPNNSNKQHCDLEVFDALANREGARLWCRKNLHAKYVRVDHRCLVGSVNLTERSTGWKSPRNFELFVEVPRHFPGLDEWETALFSDCRLVTIRPSDEQIEQSKSFAMTRPSRPSIKIDQSANQYLHQHWIPLCPRPEKLYDVYAGAIDKGEMASSAYELAQRDLRALSPPVRCTTEKDFTSAIASQLRGLKFFNYIFSLGQSGISDYHATEIIVYFLDLSHGISPYVAWKSIKLWITHFFADEYKINAHQDILVRIPIMLQENSSRISDVDQV